MIFVVKTNKMFLTNNIILWKKVYHIISNFLEKSLEKIFQFKKIILNSYMQTQNSLKRFKYTHTLYDNMTNINLNTLASPSTQHPDR